MDTKNINRKRKKKHKLGFIKMKTFQYLKNSAKKMKQWAIEQENKYLQNICLIKNWQPDERTKLSELNNNKNKRVSKKFN